MNIANLTRLRDRIAPFLLGLVGTVDETELAHATNGAGEEHQQVFHPVLVSCRGVARQSRDVAAADSRNRGQLCLSAVNPRDGVHVIERPARARIARPCAFRAGDSEFRAGLEGVFASGPTDGVCVAVTGALVNLGYSGCEIRAADDVRKLKVHRGVSRTGSQVRRPQHSVRFRKNVPEGIVLLEMHRPNLVHAAAKDSETSFVNDGGR